MKRKAYEKQLRKLQVRLCHLQEYVKDRGLRIIILFEGRDGAGKGGTIRAITERLSPRVFRIVALPAPSNREKSQIYMQRYLEHFPAAGEVVTSIAVGTTALAWNTSWAFAPAPNISGFFKSVRLLSDSSSTAASF